MVGLTQMVLADEHFLEHRPRSVSHLPCRCFLMYLPWLNEEVMDASAWRVESHCRPGPSLRSAQHSALAVMERPKPPSGQVLASPSPDNRIKTQLVSFRSLHTSRAGTKIILWYSPVRLVDSENRTVYKARRHPPDSVTEYDET
jgi:hypothetical protein